MRIMKEKIILKSVCPEEYGDLEVECRVIENDKIGEYLESIPESRKFQAYKTGQVVAIRGELGENVKTVLKTVVDGKEYILSEEEGIVRERTYTKDGQNVTGLDFVVTNISSTSNEQYIVKEERIGSTYDYVSQTEEGMLLTPKYDSRAFAQVDENIIIVTAWGSKAVCLAGSYIVTYNALENDYNTVETGAFNSTYTIETSNVKKLKRN